MRLFTCVNHDYAWPVGVASIVIADSEAAARVMLDCALVEKGLRPYGRGGAITVPYDLVEVDLTKPGAVVLLTGEY